MTRLNFSRPLLRYIDNLRREINLNSRKVDDPIEVNEISLGFVNEGNIFPFEPREAIAALELLRALESYIEAEKLIFVNKMPNAAIKSNRLDKKLSLRAINNRLNDAAIHFSQQLVLSALRGRFNLLRFYKNMEKVFTKDGGFIWDIINDKAMRKAFEKIDVMIENGCINFK